MIIVGCSFFVTIVTLLCSVTAAPHINTKRKNHEWPSNIQLNENDWKNACNIHKYSPVNKTCHIDFGEINDTAWEIQNYYDKNKNLPNITANYNYRYKTLPKIDLVSATNNMTDQEQRNLIRKLRNSAQIYVGIFATLHIQFENYHADFPAQMNVTEKGYISQIRDLKNMAKRLLCAIETVANSTGHGHYEPMSLTEMQRHVNDVLQYHHSRYDEFFPHDLEYAVNYFIKLVKNTIEHIKNHAPKPPKKNNRNNNNCNKTLRKSKKNKRKPGQLGNKRRRKTTTTSTTALPIGNEVIEEFGQNDIIEKTVTTTLRPVTQRRKKKPNANKSRRPNNLQ